MSRTDQKDVNNFIINFTFIIWALSYDWFDKVFWQKNFKSGYGKHKI